MRNKLSDLHNLLFEDIELLSDGDISDKDLERIIKVANAKAKTADVIIKNASLQLEATKFMVENGLTQNEVPEMLTYAEKKSK